MEIDFHSGIVPQYQNVLSHLHANLMISSSVGSIFTGEIKNRFRSVRLDKTDIRK